MSARGREVAAIIVRARSPATWAWCRRRPDSSRDCGALCDLHGALLIFDEVNHGLSRRLRRGPGSVWRAPGSHVLGKISGAGPVGAYGGTGRSWSASRRWEVSTRRARCRAIRLAVAAGSRRFRERSRAGGLCGLEESGSAARAGLVKGAKAAAFRSPSTGRLDAHRVFHRRPRDRLRLRQGSDTVRYGRFFHAMLDGGVFLAASQLRPPSWGWRIGPRPRRGGAGAGRCFRAIFFPLTVQPKTLFDLCFRVYGSQGREPEAPPVPPAGRLGLHVCGMAVSDLTSCPRDVARGANEP